MASLIKKKKANTIYYYVVESARVDGKPRIVHQTYLGTAESVARLAQDRSAPIPLSATTVDFGLPGALWLAAEKSRSDVDSGLFPLAKPSRQSFRQLFLGGHRIVLLSEYIGHHTCAF